MEWNEKLWQKSIGDLEDFLLPLVQTLGRSERRSAAASYLQGLLIPGQRKSITPMAERLGVDSQRLQQFITSSPWDEEALWGAIRREVIPHLEPLEAWIIDETGWLKQGRHSVGVSHQYCGAVGKTANCQVSVELAVSDGFAAAPVGGRLYLPRSWAEDAQRRRKAGVPDEVAFATKPQLALQLIRQALSEGVAPAPVLGDAAYGDDTSFRLALREAGLEYFLQVTPTQHKGWDHRVETVMKRVRRHVAPEAPAPKTLEELAAGMPAGKWKSCRWTAANGRERSTRIAWMKVWLPRLLDRPGGDLEEAWLVVDWPEGDESPYHYYLAHLHRPPTRARCLKLSRSRWQVEQYYQRSKDDLGLDHFEGRSWRGFHHHLALSAAAYLFILTAWLRYKKNFWAHMGTDAPRDPPVLAEIHRILLLLRDQI